MRSSHASAPALRPEGDHREGLNGSLNPVLERSLRTILQGQDGPEGDGGLPRTARESSAAALVVLGGGPAPSSGFPVAHYHGEKEFFPGHLASLLYLAGIQLRIARGEVSGDANVERDILRMVRAGDVDAANLIFDRITGTLSGPELEPEALELFGRRRGRLDALLRSIGVHGTRCEQKVWDRPAYGRDAQLLGTDGARENRVTAIALATLLSKLLQGQVGGEETCRRTLDLLRLDSLDGALEPRQRPRLAAGLPAGSRIWGRRAFGARLLHEAVAVELPSGLRYVLVFLSHFGERHEGLLEPLGRSVADELGKNAGDRLSTSSR